MYGVPAAIIFLEARKKSRLIDVNPDGTIDEPDTGCPQPPTPEECNTAIKLLTQFHRLARKYHIYFSSNRLETLNALRDAGEITVNDLPQRLRNKFPANLKNDNLNEIKRKCGKR